ncbi:sigma-70 family RNA polymerase sigma factor [bacterium]|nr:MAG: sigma-70 family RNA polymerase sigma factor [bacterium]
MVWGGVEPDRLEFERLIERHGPGLFSFLLYRLGRREDAEDAYAEVVMKAWAAWGTYQETGRAQAWLFTIARRRALDLAAARRWTVPLLPDAEGPSPEPGPEREAEGGYARERIARALTELTPEQKDVFLMREYGGLSFKEIAAAAGCPLSTALGRMRDAVLKLRVGLGDLDA